MAKYLLVVLLCLSAMLGIDTDISSAQELKAGEIKFSKVDVYNPGKVNDYVALKTFKAENLSDLSLDVTCKVTYRMNSFEIGSRVFRLGVVKPKTAVVYTVCPEEKDDVEICSSTTEIRTEEDIARHVKATIELVSAVPSEAKDRAKHYTAEMLSRDLSTENLKVEDAWNAFVSYSNKVSRAGTAWMAGVVSWDGSAGDLVRFDSDMYRLTGVSLTFYGPLGYGRDYLKAAKAYLARAEPLLMIQTVEANREEVLKSLKIKDWKLSSQSYDDLKNAIALHRERFTEMEKVGFRVKDESKDIAKESGN